MTFPPNKKTRPRTYGGVSEAERIIERRERLLEAGLEVFGTVGLRRATVRALCRQAGLTARYFYESFPDTEALFCAVYEQQHAAMRDFFMTRLPELPQDLHLRVDASLDLFFTIMRNERMVRVLYVESMSGSEQVSAMHFTSTRMHAEMAALLIRSDNPDVDMSPEFASGLALAINGACTTMAVQWMFGDYSIPQETMVQSCALMVRGTINELRALPRAST